MGTKQSKSDMHAHERSATIDEQNKKDARKNQEVTKLLILGSGESGKSTLLKQLVNEFGSGYDETARVRMKKFIHNNILESICALAIATDESHYNTEPVLTELVEKYRKLDFSRAILTPEVAVEIDEVWHDKGVQQAYSHQQSLQLPSSAKYFFEKVHECAQATYVPTFDDILRCRVRTTGVVQTSLDVDDSKLVIFDVGGQQNERKKWIHCFDNVDVLIFVAAISEYDQTMFEDGITNRVSESIELFGRLLNCAYFDRCTVILLLNKMDLFSAKISSSPITVCFPDLPQTNTEDTNRYTNETFAKEYIRDAFLKKDSRTDNRVHTYYVCATDSSSIIQLLQEIKDIVFEVKKCMTDS